MKSLAVLEVSRLTGVTTGPMNHSVWRARAIATRLRMALPAVPPQKSKPRQ
jgi:hypothetical protein